MSLLQRFISQGKSQGHLSFKASQRRRGEESLAKVCAGWTKWTKMGEFNSDDHYIYYCGQESLRRSGVAFTVNKRVWNAVLECNLKNDRMISIHLQGKPFKYHSYLSLYPNHWCQRSWSWMALWRPTRPSRINTKKKKKKVLFIIGDWNAKGGSQEITWSNRQI